MFFRFTVWIWRVEIELRKLMKILSPVKTNYFPIQVSPWPTAIIYLSTAALLLSSGDLFFRVSPRDLSSVSNMEWPYIWLLNHNCSTRRLYLRKVFVQTTIHCIWRERNQRKHEVPLSNVALVFKLIDCVVRDLAFY